MVPQGKRGIASGVKMLLEVPLPLVLVGLVIAPMIGKGNTTTAIVVTCAAMLVCMGLTMFVREKRPETTSEPLNWRPFISLLLMTGVFTIIILGLGQVVKISNFLLNLTPLRLGLVILKMIVLLERVNTLFKLLDLLPGFRQQNRPN